MGKIFCDLDAPLKSAALLIVGTPYKGRPVEKYHVDGRCGWRSGRSVSRCGDVEAGGGGNNDASMENEATGEGATMEEEEHTFDEGLDNIRRIRASRAHLDENWAFHDFEDPADTRLDGRWREGDQNIAGISVKDRRGGSGCIVKPSWNTYKLDARSSLALRTRLNMILSSTSMGRNRRCTSKQKEFLRE